MAAAGGPRLSDRQRVNWLRLIRTENVGPAGFRSLINRFGSAESALGALPDLAARGGAMRIPRVPTAAEASEELEKAAAAGARIVAMGEEGYPPLLRRTENCPPLLTILGDSRVFDLPAVAIVGARNASLAGVKMARKLALDLWREEAQHLGRERALGHAAEEVERDPSRGGRGLVACGEAGLDRGRQRHLGTGFHAAGRTRRRRGR